LLFIVALFAALKSIQNGNTLDSISFSPERNVQHFENSIRASEQINKALENYRLDLDADRVLVRQFHNGKQDLTGIPFTYVQTTYIAMKPMVILPADSVESKPVSTMVYFLKEMWAGDMRSSQCVALRTEEVKDPLYKQYLEQNAVQISIACPLTNLLDYPIGFVAVNYNHSTLPEGMTEEMVMAKTFELAERIGGYLKNLEKPVERKKILGIF
jgi:hypothetical protein